MNITNQNEFKALSNDAKVFCTNLLKRVCRYLDRTFPDGQIVGHEGGKWNANAWVNACMAVAGSDRSTGCWVMSKKLTGGRPKISAGNT